MIQCNTIVCAGIILCMQPTNETSSLIGFDVYFMLVLTKPWRLYRPVIHYGDVIMDTMASQITSLTIVYSTVYSGADQRKHQSSALLAFVRGIHRGSVNSPHKWPVTRKMFPFDDVIMLCRNDANVTSLWWRRRSYQFECHITTP